MDLPLVTYGSGDPEHDWNYLLGTMHALPFDHALALILRLIALAIAVSSLTYGIWLLLQMQQNRSSKPRRQFL